MTAVLRQRVVATMMACHFIAAFAALGMPPFFSLIIDRSLASNATYLVGWLYVVPTFFTALSSPWWGRLADRYGTKRLLLRAQLGLAVSFLLAGFAQDIWIFTVAMCLQGLLGGTFGASNAYLASVASGALLTRSLTLMQWSARAALVLAPVVLGIFVASAASPVTLYRYLALLPLLAALLLWRLPAAQTAQPSGAPAKAPDTEAAAAPAQIYALQFAFVCAAVMTFPYFVPFAQGSGLGASAPLAGLLFGLPHLVYLAGALPLERWLARQPPIGLLAASHLLLAVSLAAQAGAESIPSLVAWRLLMGCAMTVGYIGLHKLIAGVVHGRNAGVSFGWFESSAKWGAVAAGLATGAAVQAYDLRAPFYAGALLLLCSGCYAISLPFSRIKTSKTRQENL